MSEQRFTVTSISSCNLSLSQKMLLLKAVKDRLDDLDYEKKCLTDNLPSVDTVGSLHDRTQQSRIFLQAKQETDLKIEYTDKEIRRLQLMQSQLESAEDNFSNKCSNKKCHRFVEFNRLLITFSDRCIECAKNTQYHC